MKVIDLLNKIANGEEVKFKILSVDAIYRYDKDYQLYCETSDEICEWGIDYRWLNEEVEIIKEDKKIPVKIDVEDDGNTITLYDNAEWTILNNVDVAICNKINEIIDYLEEKE